MNNRRKFIGSLAKAGAVGLLPLPSLAASTTKESSKTSGSFFLTKPYLQNLATDACTIMWITDRPCLCWVEYGETEAMGTKADAQHLGLVDAYNYVNKIALPGLKAGTKYYYKVCSKEIVEFKPYNVSWGDTETSVVFSFSTPALQPEKVSWLVLNDIHDRPASFPHLMSLAKDFPADFVFLNGDMFDFQTDQQQIIDHLLAPLTDLFATSTPFLYTRGNHETRGKFARAHAEYFENPSQRYYFSFTQGPVHFIVLDTGEDKEDDHKEYAGLAAFDAYREQQARWLEKEIQTPAFKKAPFRVVMMHIPPFESGDWHGTMHCRELFNPLFNKGKIDLMICGHTHRYGIHQPKEDTHHYPLVIGGGPLVDKRTIMKLTADNKKLELIMLRDDGVEVGNLQLVRKK